MKSISVIVPVLNNPDSLEMLLDRVNTMGKNNDLQIEVILIDDCSKDNTPEIIKNLAEQNPQQIKYCILNENKGQHFSTLLGLHCSTGSIVITIDDDLQYAPENIPDLIDLLSQYPESIVYGIPIHKQGVSWFRLFTALILHKTTVMLGLTKKKLSSFRCMGRNTKNLIVSSAHLFVNIEHISIENKIMHQNISVPHYTRTTSKSRYTNLKLFVFVVKSIFSYTAFSFILLFMLVLAAITGGYFLRQTNGIILTGFIGLCVVLSLLITFVGFYYRKPVSFAEYIKESNCHDF